MALSVQGKGLLVSTLCAGILSVLALTFSPSLRDFAIRSVSAAFFVSPLTPIADGTLQNWQAPHYQLVDEQPCNGLTDYIYTTNAAPPVVQESFFVSLSSIPNGAYITKVHIKPCASSNNGASSTLDVFYRYNQVQSASAGNYHVSGLTPTPLATTTFSVVLPKDAASMLEAGIQLTSSTGGARLSNLVTSIEYATPTNSALLLPQAEGNYLMWAAVSASGTHYTAVNEQNCNGSTNYTEGYTGRRDSYALNLSSIPNNATITKIQLIPCASLAQADYAGTNPSQMNLFYRFNGVDSADSDPYILSGSSTTPVQLNSTTFSNLLLSKNSLTTLEIGAFVSNGQFGARLSRLGAIISYIVP